MWKNQQKKLKLEQNGFSFLFIEKLKEILNGCWFRLK